MRDLSEGQSVELQGSARLPYVLKNVAGVYSCSCPAWRNQSLPIERRTCKHLRQLRGSKPKRSASAGRYLPPNKQPPPPKKHPRCCWRKPGMPRRLSLAGG